MQHANNEPDFTQFNLTKDFEDPIPHAADLDYGPAKKWRCSHTCNMFISWLGLFFGVMISYFISSEIGYHWFGSFVLWFMGYCGFLLFFAMIGVLNLDIKPGIGCIYSEVVIAVGIVAKDGEYVMNGTRKLFKVKHSDKIFIFELPCEVASIEYCLWNSVLVKIEVVG